MELRPSRNFRQGTGQIDATGKVSNSVQIGAWVDGSMPRRGETVQGYVMGMHQGWLQERASIKAGHAVVGNASAFTLSQIAALFMTMLGTMIPVMQFSGMLSPVSSLVGTGGSNWQCLSSVALSHHQPRRV